MKSANTLQKLKAAEEKDPTLLCDKTNVESTFGHNPDYLQEVLGLTKSDLIRLQRLGRAVKTRYEIKRTDKKTVTGTHRTRWLIFKETQNAE